MTQPHWYFAYGSNMQAATFRDRRRLEALQVSIGRLDGYTLCFDIPVGPGQRGVANICVREGSSVWGVLYLLTPEQHEHLDRTEGVPNGLYKRVRVEVSVGEALVEAETFVSELRDPARLPSHRYRSLLLEGAREHGLPEDWIRSLEDWEMAWDERDGAINPEGVLRRR